MDEIKLFLSNLLAAVINLFPVLTRAARAGRNAAATPEDRRGQDPQQDIEIIRSSGAVEEVVGPGASASTASPDTDILPDDVPQALDGGSPAGRVALPAGGGEPPGPSSTAYSWPPYPFVLRALVLIVVVAGTALALVVGTWSNTDLEENGIILTKFQKGCIMLDSIYPARAVPLLGDVCRDELSEIHAERYLDRTVYTYTNDDEAVQFGVCKMTDLFCNLEEDELQSNWGLTRWWPYIGFVVGLLGLLSTSYELVSRRSRRSFLEWFGAVIGVSFVLHVAQNHQVWVLAPERQRVVQHVEQRRPFILQWDTTETKNARYPLGRYELSEGMKEKLDRMIPEIRSMLEQGIYNAVLVEGHTDGVPISKDGITDEEALRYFRQDMDALVDSYAQTPSGRDFRVNSNIELGYLRAVAVMRRLEKGLKGAPIHVASFSCNKRAARDAEVGYQPCEADGDPASRRVVVRPYRYAEGRPDSYEYPTVMAGAVRGPGYERAVSMLPTR